jgi:hypothetical protein
MTKNLFDDSKTHNVARKGRIRKDSFGEKLVLSVQLLLSPQEGTSKESLISSQKMASWRIVIIWPLESDGHGT